VAKTSERDIAELINKVYEGKLAIPNFQRRFIWTRKEIEDLLVSVFQDFFMGTLLFLNTDPNDIPFSPLLIEGVREVNADAKCTAVELILDGQQRVSSLFYACYAPNIPVRGTSYPYKFFVYLDKALNAIAYGDSSALEDAIYSSRWKRDLDPGFQYSERVLPLTNMLTIEGFETWLRGLEDYEKGNGTIDYNRLNDYRLLREKFSNYKVAVVNLSQFDEDLIEIVEVFERVNSKGTPLSVFELLTSRFYTTVNLRELWEESFEKNDLLREFSGDEKDERFPRYILQVIALKRGKECKKKALFELEKKGLKEDWLLAVEYIERALNRLNGTASGCYGVRSFEWIPYTTMIPPLATLLIGLERPGSGVLATEYEKLHRWYWASVFFNRYEYATDTKAYNDVRDVKTWFSEDSYKPGFMVELEKEFEQVGVLFKTEEILKSYTLEGEYSKGSAIYKGVISLIILEGALDFFSGDTIELHKLDDHHVFPVAVLSKRDRKITSSKINTILNRTLISKETNRRIKDKKPSEYLADMVKKLGSIEKTRAVLASHFIDDAGYDAMSNDDYDAFILARERMIVKEILLRCGFS
jgi:hypothetical protein